MLGDQVVVGAGGGPLIAARIIVYRVTGSSSSRHRNTPPRIQQYIFAELRR